MPGSSLNKSKIIFFKVTCVIFLHSLICSAFFSAKFLTDNKIDKEDSTWLCKFLQNRDQKYSTY